MREEYITDRAVVETESEGLVVDYPGIASRVGGAPLGSCDGPSRCKLTPQLN